MKKRSFDFSGRADDTGKISGYVFRFAEVAVYAGQRERFSEDLEFQITLLELIFSGIITRKGF